MINKDRVVQEFMKYVQIDSPTKKERQFADFITKELEDLGLEVTMDEAGEKCGSDSGNVIAKLAGNKDVEPILFSCHMDTVSPGQGIKPVVREGVIYSDGTTILGADDKAGIAALMEALKTLKEKNIDHGPIEVVFSISEEGGLHGAKHLDYSQIQSKRAIVLDSGGSPGEIIIQGPAQDQLNVKVIGKPSHAGVSPEDGISAINVASHAISRMNLLRIDEETTANIGIIQGGEATNIVTPEVYVEAEARSLDHEKLEQQSNHMVKCFKEAAQEFGAQVEINIERQYDAFKVEENDEIVTLVKKACHNLDITPYTAKTGGGSDTNVLNTRGIKAVNLGTGDCKPHTLEEHISIEDLENISKLVLEIIKQA